MLLFSSIHRTAGIDISDHLIRAVIIEKHFHTRSIKHFAEIVLPDGAIIDGIIQNAMEVEKALLSFHKKMHTQHVNAVVSLPESHAFIKTILVKENQDITKEIAKHIPFSISEVYIDTMMHRYVLNEQGTDRKQLISFAAVKKDIVESYYMLFKTTGFHVRAFEIESQSFARLFANHARDNRVIILCDIGKNHTTFAVAQDGHIDFTYTSNAISGGNLTTTIAQQLEITEEEAEQQKIAPEQHATVQPLIDAYIEKLQGELKRVLDFHQEHAAVEDSDEYIIYCIGGGAKILNLAQRLEDNLAIPVQLPTTALEIQLPKELEMQLYSYGTAIGLSLRDYHPV